MIAHQRGWNWSIAVVMPIRSHPSPKQASPRQSWSRLLRCTSDQGCPGLVAAHFPGLQAFASLFHGAKNAPTRSTPDLPRRTSLGDVAPRSGVRTDKLPAQGGVAVAVGSQDDRNLGTLGVDDAAVGHAIMIALELPIELSLFLLANQTVSKVSPGEWFHGWRLPRQLPRCGNAQLQ